MRLVQALIEADEPPSPVAKLFGTTIVEASVGSVTLTSTPGPDAMSRRGGVHGGVVATLLDTALVLAAVTALDTVDDFSTVELSIHYLRPVPADVTVLLTRAEVLKAGRRLSFCQARVEDAAGTVFATATGTVAVG
ncbi:PaaI family thioesterase [Nocardioides dilutus]